MNRLKATLVVFLCSLLITIPTFASDVKKEFDSEKMIEELEKKLELSREKWEQLKPVLEEKGRQLQQSMHESVDKGYVELEELSKKLEAMSEDAERKVREVLSSEEARKLREYLGKIDEDALLDAKERVVAEMTALLELTEQQAAKIKPVLEESVARLTVLLDDLAREGARNWEEFSREFEQLTNDLKDSLKENLDQKQMERLERYNREQKEKIHNAVFTV